MGCKTIRSSQHKLVDTLNTRFWSSDIQLCRPDLWVCRIPKRSEGNEMNILWLSRADGVLLIHHSGWKLAEGPELLEEYWWSLPRGPPLRQASGPAQKDLGSLSSTPPLHPVSQCSCSLRARFTMGVCPSRDTPGSHGRALCGYSSEPVM